MSELTSIREDIMTITFGGRQLIVSLVGRPTELRKQPYPEFENATDDEMFRFALRRSNVEQQHRQEVNAAMLGGLWVR